MPVSVVALIACHNRRELTVTCLRTLFRVTIPGLDLSVVLVDDGSTDGTRQAVEELGYPVTVVDGPGDWFWSRSMAEAERVAELRDPDWLLWLNDDVEVSPQGLMQFVAMSRTYPDSILVGPLCSRVRTGRVMFSGFMWPDPGDILRICVPGAVGEICEAEGFHGNFVAVPRAVRQRVGPIDRRWPHNFADLDYSRRARRAGVRILTMPFVAGWCEPDWKPYADPRRTPIQRMRAVLSRRGWPVRAHLRFLIKHRGGQRVRGFFRLYRRAWVGQRPSRDIADMSRAPHSDVRSEGP